MARNFEAYIFICVNVSSLELLTQVLWLLKLLQKKSWFFHLHVRSAIDRFSQSLIHLLVNFMGQSMICRCCVPYVYFMPYAYGTYRTRMVHTIRVWYFFCTIRTCMVLPYAYTVSHSIKLSIITGGSIPNAYYA